LALTRSRHFYYNVDHATKFPPVDSSPDALYNAGWYYDGSSDFGRIDRQDAFLRGMVDQAKKLYNPFKLDTFITQLTKGVTLDSTFTLDELIGLAERFHGINANSILTYTLPTTAVNNTALGDVLYVEQPYAQQQLVSIFGSQLEKPADPPPNTDNVSTPPPYVPVTTTTTTSPTTTTKPTKKTSSTTVSTTTTTNPTLAVPPFDPTTCTP
jgi:anionic cell wall polymer biosynthesis LytR-Cps2A-Psr (LCP) family protein